MLQPKAKYCLLSFSIAEFTSALVGVVDVDHSRLHDFVVNAMVQASVHFHCAAIMANFPFKPVPEEFPGSTP
jgi:hypothetical protein